MVPPTWWRRIGRPRSRIIGGLPAAACFLLTAAPAAALEELELRLPLLNTNLVVRLDELGNGESLWLGRSDLAELDRATDGAVGRMALRLFSHPLPLPSGVARGLEGSVDSPLLHEALLATTALVRVDGTPVDLNGEALSTALRRSEADGGTPTLLSLLGPCRAGAGRWICSGPPSFSSVFIASRNLLGS